MDIFSHTFRMTTPGALRQLFLFLAQNCLTNAILTANLCLQLTPVHYQISTTCTENIHFKNRCYDDETHQLSSNEEFHGCD